MVKRYGFVRKSEALRDVSIQVGRGECFGLAGPNGAGKTTLIKLLLGLTQPDEGEVRLFGQRPDDPEVRRRVGFVPESAELPPAASPRGLVKRLARLRGLEVRTYVPRGVEQLERMGMGELLDRPAGKLSKGEKQRTLLALALLPDPELLILDEPTDGLDPLGRALVRRVLREERARGRTVFLNSHLLSETERVCTRVAILHKGRVVREEEIRERNEAAGVSAVVLSAALPDAVLQAAGARIAPLLQGHITESAGVTLLIDHDGLGPLNAALDQLRAAGGLIDEVRRVRQDLEASFEAAVTGAAVEPAPRGPPPPEAEESPRSLLRGPRAVSRVTGEIIADLLARKVGWVALAAALLFLGFFLWGLHNEVVAGAAAMVRRWSGPGGLTDETSMGQLVGRYAAATIYWGMLPGSAVFAAFFAPALLDPRRSILILSQPISRGDLAAGIYTAVCSFVAAEYLFLIALLFGGLRFLGIHADPRFLLVPLPLLFAFASIYVVELAFTYALRSGPASGAIGIGVFAAAGLVGANAASQHGLYWTLGAAVLPKVTPLSMQAMRIGGAEAPAAGPFVLSLLFTFALGLVVLFAARRSEQ